MKEKSLYFAYDIERILKKFSLFLTDEMEVISAMFILNNSKALEVNNGFLKEAQKCQPRGKT